MVNIGTTTIFGAELWGLREGLRLCKSLNIQHLHIEMDSATIVHVINNARCSTDALAILLLDCTTMLQQFSNYTLTHIYREGNKAADHLAELGHHTSKGTTILQDPPLKFKFSSNKTSQDTMSLDFSSII